MKAHVIPRALTAVPEDGLPLAQAGDGAPPVRRWDSWYDADIVVQAGENILTGYDTWAIEQMRRHRLVWSSWEGERLEAPGHSPMPDSAYGVREVGIDARRLRLFFLSVLWRAAASRLPEFREVRIPPREMRHLTRMVLEGDPSPLGLFPVALTQLSTIGPVHNQSPIASMKEMDPSRPGERMEPIFRFFFDGLAVHFHRKRVPEHLVERHGALLVGVEADRIVVPTVTFEESWQRSNLGKIVEEAESEYGERLDRFWRRANFTDREEKS